MADLKLHGFWYSPFTLRVAWTLKLKGIPYENIEEDRFNMSPQLLQYNPIHKKTPVLVHAGKPICESMLIVEYIDEIWSHNPVLPSDPYERAQARFWVQYSDELVIAVSTVFLASNVEEQEKGMKKILELLKVVEDQCLGNQKKFFGGETLNIVDLVFGSITACLLLAEDISAVKVLGAENFPHLYSWFNTFKNVPVIAENLPDREKLLAFAKFFREKTLASS